MAYSVPCSKKPLHLRLKGPMPAAEVFSTNTCRSPPSHLGCHSGGLGTYLAEGTAEATVNQNQYDTQSSAWIQDGL